MVQDIRKLITLAKISEVIEIPNAERIVGYRVRGWVVVDTRDKYTVGDTVLYIEPDAFLPAGVEQWDFLVEKSSRTVPGPNGVEVTGHVLKTIKLRGQVSQGLILPLSFNLTADSTQEEIQETFSKLGVFKYEPPLPSGGGVQIAAFPVKLARKTDSERVQNVTDEWLQSLEPTEWVASEKIDGMSSTFWKIDGELHCAGRNWELSLEGNHPHAELARKLKLAERMPEGAVIQGEIYGEGIQKNPLKVQGHHLGVFSYQLANVAMDTPEVAEFEEWVKKLMVPTVDISFPTTVIEAIEQVEVLKSAINPNALAEGVVWWHKQGKNFAEVGDRPNFKSISAKYLLKHDA